MIKENYRHCPVCAAPLKYRDIEGQAIPRCSQSSCGFIFWQNSKPAVAAVIANERHEILMTIRAIEPDSGKLDLPGGFLYESEQPTDGVKREVQEELGVDIEVDGVLDVMNDSYDSDTWVMNIAMLAHIVSGEPTPQDEIAAIEWVDPKHVDSTRLAFNNNEFFLKLWLEKQSK